ncbi:MAG: LysM peptidoglycan-binding domain-containing protein [Treponema sp.]|jgi:hypothetical protein|nr:LysM peptidoglycan-binding domain-containing protein [Treponema sp.]
MSRRINLVLIVVVFAGVQPLFAQYALAEPELPASLWSATFIAAEDEGTIVPGYIRNNRYYLESRRMNKLAQDTYEYGDYDLSAEYAKEAIRYAQLSDEYVALQLKMKEANDTIAAAKQRLDWAVSSGAAAYFPAEYGQARQYYDNSLAARSAEQWDEAIAEARRVINTLAYIRVPDTSGQIGQAEQIGQTGQDLAGGSNAGAGQSFLPAQYTVKPWADSRDCLWNIAGRPWAYGDATEWRLLYNANRAKMTNPDNPDLIHPGMVLDIPSIRGEERRGMWSETR